ncbi:hypothetical protein D8875_11385 [Streptococcus sanguinis]|nr:hypothetical protein D8875_11385 [Streptococcus sanguinis]
MAWSEGDLTFLDLTLQAFCLSASTSWSYFRKFWAVGSRYWSAILVHTFHCHWFWCTNILFFRCESHYAIWCNGVSSLTWNLFLLTSICEGRLYCVIDWNKWVAALESRCASLRDPLRTCASHIGASRNHFFHYRLVLNCNRGAIGISACQFKLWCFTLELFVWSKGHLTICIHFEFTDIWNFFHC